MAEGYDYEKRIVQALRQLTQFLDTHSRQLFRQHAITIPQVLCMDQLVDRGPLTVAVLAERVHLSASTTVGILDRLEKKKFVRRKRSSDDRRSVFVEITEEGRRFLKETPQLLHNRLYDLLRSIGDKRVQIADALDTLITLLKSHI